MWDYKLHKYIKSRTGVENEPNAWMLSFSVGPILMCRSSSPKSPQWHLRQRLRQHQNPACNKPALSCTVKLSFFIHYPVGYTSAALKRTNLGWSVSVLRLTRAAAVIKSILPDVCLAALLGLISSFLLKYAKNRFRLVKLSFRIE